MIYIICMNSNSKQKWVERRVVETEAEEEGRKNERVMENMKMENKLRKNTSWEVFLKRIRLDIFHSLNSEDGFSHPRTTFT